MEANASISGGGLLKCTECGRDGIYVAIADGRSMCVACLNRLYPPRDYAGDPGPGNLAMISPSDLAALREKAARLDAIEAEQERERIVRDFVCEMKMVQFECKEVLARTLQPADTDLRLARWILDNFTRKGADGR